MGRKTIIQIFQAINWENLAQVVGPWHGQEMETLREKLNLF